LIKIPSRFVGLLDLLFCRMQTKCHPDRSAPPRDQPDHCASASTLPIVAGAYAMGKVRVFQTAGDVAWIEVASRGEVPAGGMLEVEGGGRALLLYDLDGTVFATSAICPHHAAFLSQGHVSGETIECPRHMGCFHIPTGRQERGPACPDLRTYKVRVEDQRVLVEI
jgi:3-phenylpropionate/trans-cinnamate dioxygenase ferredoxin subunit